MANETSGKTVLVTGTSTGIGHATALHLDQLGYQVVGTVRKESDAQNLRASASSNLRTLFLDVTSASSIDQFKEALRQELGDGGLWGLVNNAGVGFISPLEFVPLDQLRWLFEVNLFGLLAVTQVCLPYLRQEKGRIINISSVASIIVVSRFP
jgi:NAD(P)-dependent dehydrogenase (short-subunit alcohol dehydrogenase family)